jgi:PAS domain-containing protein
MTTLPDWIEKFPGAITVCDTKGIILYMNDTAAEQFAKDGGRDLIGQNVLDCCHFTGDNVPVINGW